jgi:hypothetical protein
MSRKKKKSKLLVVPPVSKFLVFVSHAAGDKALLDALAALLETGCAIPSERIFYSSNASAPSLTLGTWH